MLEWSSCEISKSFLVLASNSSCPCKKNSCALQCLWVHDKRTACTHEHGKTAVKKAVDEKGCMLCQ